MPATHVIPVPDELALDLAAAIPVNYLTAYIGLVRVAQVRRGECVLVHAAAGGVGLAAVQLAASFGARVIATASQPKHEFLRQLDVVDAVIDYNDADWDDQVREAAGRGVDVVLDGIGEDNFRKSLHTLAFGGRLAAFGLTSAMTSSTSPSVVANLDVEGLMIPFSPLFENAWSVGGVTGGAPPAQSPNGSGCSSRCACAARSVRTSVSASHSSTPGMRTRISTSVGTSGNYCSRSRDACLRSGASRTRTGDLLGAIQTLSQLSYSPVFRTA